MCCFFLFDDRLLLNDAYALGSLEGFSDDDDGVFYGEYQESDDVYGWSSDSSESYDAEEEM